MKTSHDVFVCSTELMQQLLEIQKFSETLAHRLMLLDQLVAYIFSQIKSCSITDAEEYFILLKAIQKTLCKIVYIDQLDAPSRLKRFMHDFDNFGHDKNYYFPKIQRGEYRY